MTATLPYRWYADAEMLALERSRLFAPAWHYGGHADLVPEHLCCRAPITPPPVQAPRRRGRPPKNRSLDQHAG